MLMERTVKAICESDQTLCESILDLYQNLLGTEMSVGDLLWERIEEAHNNGTLANVFRAGKRFGLDDAIVTIYEGHNPKTVYMVKSVGDYRNDQLFINIRPFHSKYASANAGNRQLVDREGNIILPDLNDFAYKILSFCKSELMSMVDNALRNQVKRRDTATSNIERIREAYGGVSPELAPQAEPLQV
jgi:hypothetical protein